MHQTKRNAGNWKFNNLMFSIRTDFAVDTACWILAGRVLICADCSLSLLTSSASKSPLLDRKNSYIPLAICGLKLRALVASAAHSLGDVGGREDSEKSIELEDLRDDIRTKLIMLNGTLKISIRLW